jgi:NAD(P)-dependent dehydrogenase (short-subunit alcohol dehydrogenase family)
LARGTTGLDAAKTEMEELGGSGLSIPTDVADAQQVEDAAATVEQELGPIDIWVNNAMTTIFAPLCEITPAEFKRATEVTYLGTVYGTMAALRRMLPRDRGSIVQVGSALAYRSIPLQAPYCGAKHAIRGFTDSLRSELLHDHSNVHVTMVQMPALNTPQFSWCRTRLPRHPQPVPPIYQPEVAAEAVVWAAHHRRRELFVGESTEKAIWANKIAPGYLDSYLARHGYEDQQAQEPVDPNRPDNLFHPIAGDAGARGIFDRSAKNSSFQLRADTHRGSLVAAAGFLASLAFVAVVGSRR